MTRDDIIEILNENKINIDKGEWNTVYENVVPNYRGDFSDFLIENDVDPNTMFKGEIPRDSFGWSKLLTSITIPETVTKIGEYAFQHCKSLDYVAIPNSVTTISKGAFMTCALLTSITIPNSVKSIGNSAFYNCFSLTEIKFDGTQEEWEMVDKGIDWIRYCPVNKKKNKITFLK